MGEGLSTDAFAEEITRRFGKIGVKLSTQSYEATTTVFVGQNQSGTDVEDKVLLFRRYFQAVGIQNKPWPIPRG